jgi:hypothetical protein
VGVQLPRNKKIPEFQKLKMFGYSCPGIENNLKEFNF